MRTYAQNFEDVILERLFKEVEKGFYVDIGAWDPSLYSVTRHFYNRGWHGVNVEPIANRARSFESERPRDLNLCAAVGQESGEAKFYECIEESYGSTIDRNSSLFLQSRGLSIKEYKIKLITLNEIFERYVSGEVDFLKIDVGIFSGELLKGFDLQRYRPRALVIHAGLPSIRAVPWEDLDQIGPWSSWEPAVLERGYVLAHFDGLNRFYLRSEDFDLAKRLRLPLNVYDAIEPAGWPELKRERELLIEKQVELVRKIGAKDAVLSGASSELVGYRSAIGGALEIVYRQRARSGGQLSGGAFVSSASGSSFERRIALDVMQIEFGVSGGVEVYMRTLVQALINLPGIDVVLLCLSAQRNKLQALFGDRVGYFVYSQRPSMRVSGRFGEIVRNRKVVETVRRVPASFAFLNEEIGANILHSPIQCYSLYDFKIPAVLHLHDLQHLHFPENFSESDIAARNKYYGLSADLSDAIIATSDFVRDDIIAKMGVSSGKVFRIPATWDPKVELGVKRFSKEDAQRLYRLPPTFALYPAQFWPHKNHARLVEALAIARKSSCAADLCLVLTGNRAHSGWPKVAETIEHLGLQQEVVCLDYVPVEHLAALYRAARFCIMPSTFEASSYPVIEAQLLGCPAMCSNVTSLPELMHGGAGILFDPYSPEDMAEKMLGWLRHPDDATECARRAAEKVRREHSMSAYAESIAAVYQHISPRSLQVD